MRRLVLVWTVLAVAGCAATSTNHVSDAESANALALVAIETGRPAIGISILEEAIGRNPYYAPHYLALAAAWSHYQHADLVVANLRKYLEIHPDYHQARLYLGEVLYDQQKLDEAKQNFEVFLASSNPVPNPHFVAEMEALESAVTDREGRCHRHRKHAASRLSEIATAADDPFLSSYYAALRDYESALANIGSVEEKEPNVSQQLAAALDALEVARATGENPAVIDAAKAVVASALKERDAGRPVRHAPWPGLPEHHIPRFSTGQIAAESAKPAIQ